MKVWFWGTRGSIPTPGPTGDLAVILPGITPEHLPMVEERLQETISEALKNRRYKGDSPEVIVGGSTLHPKEGNPQELIWRAREDLGQHPG